MLLGVIADDFTGASDIANTISKGLPGRGGLKAAQFLGVPENPAPVDIEAGVVALKSRSTPVQDAVGESLKALDWLLAQGCKQIIFKYCSTFDSTKEGNIGPVGEALADKLGVKGVVACPAFPTMGRTIYQGHLFVNDWLLNESGLEAHPLNPMTDANIRRWLAHQTKAPVGLVAMNTIKRGSAAVKEELNAAAARGETMVITDATSDDDLLVLAEALADAKLITGGSGIALGLSENFFKAGLAKPENRAAPTISGPDAILAGSCSGATQGQIEVHAKSHPTLPIDVAAVMENRLGATEIVNFLVANTGKAPLAYSSGNAERVRELQAQYGAENVSARLDALFGGVAKTLVENGIRRLVVAGGETSGAVVSALNLGALTIGEEIDPGVPTLFSHGDDPIGLALKSGNFGAPDFFTKALTALEG